MHKSLLTLIAVVLIHSSLLVAFASVDEQYLTTKKLRISNYQAEGSKILGSQPDEQACGEMQGNDFFIFKGAVDELNGLMDKAIVVKSWKQLGLLQKKSLQSKLLENIKKENFRHYDFAIVLIPFTGLQHIKKERLYQNNNSVMFSYELWEWQANEVPACLWLKLYVLKLKKRH